MTLLNLQKSIYNIQKECFDRVNLEETTIPFLWKWNDTFMWLGNKKLLVWAAHTDAPVELGYTSMERKWHLTKMVGNNMILLIQKM